MNKFFIAIIGLLITIFGGFTVYSIIETKKQAVDFKSYNLDSIISANDDNGQIGDHIIGNPKAKAILFEYADYECPGCADAQARVSKIIEKYGDKIAVVYRSIVLNYHPNSTAATQSAEAAGLQGYWQEYSRLLFANQSSWSGVSVKERTQAFYDLFLQVSNGKGDLEKFKQDINSKQVRRKVAFDAGISERRDVPGTPAFYVAGNYISMKGVKSDQDFIDKISAALDKELAK